MCRTLSMSAREGRSCSSSLARLWIGGIFFLGGVVFNVVAGGKKTRGEHQWEQIVQEAKKEGQVTVTSIALMPRCLIPAPLKRLFPKSSWWSSAGLKTISSGALPPNVVPENI